MKDNYSIIKKEIFIMRKIFTVVRIVDKKKMVSYDNIFACFDFMVKNGVWDYIIEENES